MIVLQKRWHTFNSDHAGWYTAPGDSNISVGISQRNNRVTVSIGLSRTLKFKDQIIEFERIIQLARPEFYVDSVERIKIYFYSRSSDFVHGISSTPGVQQYLAKVNSNDTVKLDRAIIGNYFKHSSQVSDILNLFNLEQHDIEGVFVEKCHYDSSLQPDSSVKFLISCSHLWVNIR